MYIIKVKNFTLRIWGPNDLDNEIGVKKKQAAKYTNDLDLGFVHDPKNSKCPHSYLDEDLGKMLFRKHYGIRRKKKQNMDRQEIINELLPHDMDYSKIFTEYKKNGKFKIFFII